MHQWFFSFLNYSAMPFVALNNVWNSLININYFMFSATFTFTDNMPPYQRVRTEDGRSGVEDSLTDQRASCPLPRDWNPLHFKAMYTNLKYFLLPWARILKHSMEAEKSTFQGELSFQRSECTAGLTVATSFLCCL
jgi:hypothetical protein